MDPSLDAITPILKYIVATNYAGMFSEVSYNFWIKINASLYSFLAFVSSLTFNKQLPY